MPIIIDSFEALPAEEPPRRPEPSASGDRTASEPDPETWEHWLVNRREREERVRAH